MAVDLAPRPAEIAPETAPINQDIADVKEFSMQKTEGLAATSCNTCSCKGCRSCVSCQCRCKEII